MEEVIVSLYHGMVWVGRDLTDHLVAPCGYGQGPLPPDQVAQSPVQPGLEHCQGGGKLPVAPVFSLPR